MTTQPAGEHHTGTLELAGQGNPQQTTARDILAEQLWSEVWDSERPYDEANDPERAACEAATDRVLAVLEPAIRQQVAEQIAGKAEEAADDLELPVMPEWLDQRDWFKDQLHKLAADAREIGGGQ